MLLAPRVSRLRGAKGQPESDTPLHHRLPPCSWRLRGYVGYARIKRARGRRWMRSDGVHEEVVGKCLFIPCRRDALHEGDGNNSGVYPPYCPRDFETASALFLVCIGLQRAINTRILRLDGSCAAITPPRTVLLARREHACVCAARSLREKPRAIVLYIKWAINNIAKRAFQVMLATLVLV